MRSRTSEPNSSKYNDFLQILIEASKEEPANTKTGEVKGQDSLRSSESVFAVASEDGPNKGTTSPSDGRLMKYLDEDEIIAGTIIFFLAGYESITVALALSVYIVTRSFGPHVGAWVPSLVALGGDRVNGVYRASSGLGSS